MLILCVLIVDFFNKFLKIKCIFFTIPARNCIHKENAVINISNCVIPVVKKDIFSGGIAFLQKIELKV